MFLNDDRTRKNTSFEIWFQTGQKEVINIKDLKEITRMNPNCFSYVKIEITQYIETIWQYSIKNELIVEMAESKPRVSSEPKTFGDIN